MTKLQKWRAEEWFPEAKLGGNRDPCIDGNAYLDYTVDLEQLVGEGRRPLRSGRFGYHIIVPLGSTSAGSINCI